MTARIIEFGWVATPFPLGRHVEHDEASKAFRAQLAPDVLDVRHAHTSPYLDQGAVGSCTGNGLVHATGTEPRTNLGITLDEALALKVYTRATQLDGFAGEYPAQDTGSSGLAAAKACMELGLIKGYDHAFGLEEVLRAASLRPVCIGIPWYSSMFDVGADAFIRITGDAWLAGGHELVIDGVRLVGEYVTLLNSWGTTWGRYGRCRLSWVDLGRLLSEQGDALVPRYVATAA